MKTARTLFFLIVAVLAMTSAQTTYAQQRITTKDYNVSAFSVIESNVVGNIEFTYSPNTQVEATGNQEFVDNLVIKVENGVLKLSKKNKIDRENFFKRFTPSKKSNLKIRIGAPVLTEIRSKGVSDFTAESIDTDKFSIVSDGVGNVNLKNVTCDELTVRSKGVGNVVLKGKTETLSIKSDGVGDIEARDLTVVDGDIVSTGVGNVTCNVTRNLSIRKSGVGNVRYHGNPTIKSMNASGPGRVKSEN